MAKKVQDRYANVADLILDLESLQRGEAPMLARSKFEAQTLADLADGDGGEELGPEFNESAALRQAQAKQQRAERITAGLTVALAVSALLNLVLIALKLAG